MKLGNVYILHRESATGGNGETFFSRLVLFRCPWFGIMVNRFHQSDDACPHSHPWNYLSVILWGGYLEHGNDYPPVPMPNGFAFARPYHRWYVPGSVLFRRAGHVHRLEIPPGRKCLTLFCHGPERQPWGFYTPAGYQDWRVYNAEVHCPGVAE